MKPLTHLNEYRVNHPIFKVKGDDYNGAFIIPFEGYLLRVIASDGNGWDHVSVSMKRKIPNWKHMCFIKDLFFHEEETVIQFHPKKSEYINNHSCVLHLWRNQKEEFTLPDSIMVGIKGLEIE